MLTLFRYFFLTLSLLWFSSAAHGDEAAPLRLGIMPFNSTLALIKTHQPLRQHLQKALDRPVEIYTSPNYDRFQRASLAGEYDLLITGPHFGAMCLEQGWEPLFHYKTRLTPLFVVGKDSGIRHHDDLRGKRIGLSNRLSVSSIVGLMWLNKHGLRTGQDFTVHERTTHGAAIAGVAVGDLDAALTTHTPLKQIPPDVRAAVTLLTTDVSVPHLMTLAHQRLGKPEIERIRRALAAFPNTAEGTVFFKDTGYLGYDPISPADLRALAPYTPIVREMMGL